MRFHAADLADLDREGRLAGFGREAWPGQDQRHFVARLEIVRAADDLPLALAVVHPANGELVGIRMLVAGDDLGDDDPFEFAAEFLDAFDFDARAWSAARRVPRATSRNRRIASAS